MRKKTQKFISVLAAATMLASTLAVSACGTNYSLDTPLSMPTETTVDSNGGFAVEVGEYVYFINGAESYTATNTYGDVVKGSLMRIKKADLATTSMNNAEVVIPTLVGSQNFETGIFVYDGYVYYATPTADKNIHGEVENSWIDFKSAKLDGTEVMSGFMFRLSANNTNFRFVKEGDTVYCMYVEDGVLKSYNTKTKETTVLVKGAGSYFFDKKDVTNGTVYYTMGVTYDIASDKATSATYNQIYKVNASATAETKVEKETVSYTVKDGRTYSFNKAYLEEQNEEAKKDAEENKTDYEAVYDLKDYTTYPYVNLGELVIDGVGSACQYQPMFNDVTEAEMATAGELQGYKYTIARYENGGVYYTRTQVTPNTNLYYLADNTTETSLTANANSDVVAEETTNASSTDLFEIVDGKHQYSYLSCSDVYRATQGEEPVKLFGGASGKTLWKTEDNYLYVYGAGEGTSGNVLSRIYYTGEAKKYDTILNANASDEYRLVTLDYVDMANSWYNPEIIDGYLLYANAKTVGSTSYNYIYATALDKSVANGTAEDIAKKLNENNDAYEAVLDYFDEELTIDVKNAANYLFSTYVRKEGDAKDETQAFFVDFKASQENYKEFNDGKELAWKATFEEEVVAKLIGAEKEYIVQSDLIKFIGATSEEDGEAMAEVWKNYLPFEEAEEEEFVWEWWYTLLIVIGGVLVLGGAGVAVVLVLHNKKVKAAEAEATVNAYKTLKIDTTDDKSIDVYADDTPAEETKEEAVEVTEEKVEATEEATEEVAEEAPASENE